MESGHFVSYIDWREWVPGGLGSTTDMEVAARVALALCRYGRSLPVHVVQRPVDALRMCRADYAGADGGLCRLAHVHGQMWAYDPLLGVWAVVPDSTVHRMISLFHGMTAVVLEGGRERVKAYHVNGHVLGAVLSLLRLQMLHEDFAWGAGAVYGDVAVWADNGEIRQAAIGAGWQDGDALEVELPAAIAQRDRRMRIRYNFRLPRTAGRWGSISPDWHLPCTAGVWREVMPTLMGHCQTMWGHRPDDLPQYLQALAVWLGLGLLGRATGAQRALYLIGPIRGANGKSTLMELLKACLPASMVAHEDPAGWQQDYQRGGLAEGQAFNLVPDTEAWDARAAAWAKLAIGGEPISARRIGAPPFVYQPVAAWMVGSNTIQTASVGGLARRLTVLECDARITGATVTAAALVRRMMDGGEVPYVHAWGLNMASQSLHALGGGIPVPSSASDAEGAALRSATPFLEWASEHIVSQAGARMRLADILTRYRKDMGTFGARVTQDMAARTLRQLGMAERNHGGYLTYEVRVSG